MMRIKTSSVSLILALALGAAANAQDSADARAKAEALTAWEWQQQLQLPDAGAANQVDFVVPPAAFDKARADLADLRLYDARAREIPYALRIRRTVIEQEPLAAREFNRIKNADRSVEVSLDLGERPAEHNQIDIVTSGNDFRRHVQLQASDTSKTWSALVEHSDLIHFQAGQQVIDIHKLNYPASRLRYLRVHVFPETGNEKDSPTISSVVVYHSLDLPGEYQTQKARLGPREPVREPGRAGFGPPGSAWRIDFGGEAAPCERLRFEIADEDFARSYSLEIANPGEEPRLLQSGEWRRRAGAERTPIDITFQEVTARGFRLVVTDFRNPALNIKEVEYTAPVRQVIFPRSADLALPIYLYYGNPNAQASHYDFAANLPARLETAPARARLDPRTPNQTYRPMPKPWSERWPWVVYLVLGLATAVLLCILGMLARESLARHEQQSRVPASGAS